MKLFLSWSGDRSHAMALFFQEWLQCVIQACDPWVSSKDLEQGSVWHTEINSALQGTNIGIICLTKENQNNPWILFEAGALSKGLETNRVIVFLVDIEVGDLSPPLSLFHTAEPKKESVKGVVKTINNSLKEKQINNNVLDRIFDTYWDQFSNEYKRILETHPSKDDIKKETKGKSGDDILNEILLSTKGLSNRIQALEIAQREDSSYRKSKTRYSKELFSELKEDMPDLSDKMIDTIIISAASSQNIHSFSQILSNNGIELDKDFLKDIWDTCYKYFW